MYFCTLKSIPSVGFLFSAMPHCLDYCPFVVHLRIGKYESSYFISLFMLGNSSPLYLHMNYTNQVVNSTKKYCGILIGLCKSGSIFGEYCHLSILSILVCELWTCFPYVYILNFFQHSFVVLRV